MAPSGAINYLKEAPAAPSKNFSAFSNNDLAGVAASGSSAINLTSVKPAKPSYQAPPVQSQIQETTNGFDNYQNESYGGNDERLFSHESIERTAPIKPPTVGSTAQPINSNVASIGAGVAKTTAANDA